MIVIRLVLIGSIW